MFRAFSQFVQCGHPATPPLRLRSGQALAAKKQRRGAQVGRP
jgi:hypothetical protein